MKQKRVQFVLSWLRRSAGSRQQSLLKSRVRTLGSEVGAVEKQVHGIFQLVNARTQSDYGRGSYVGRWTVFGRIWIQASELSTVWLGGVSARP